MSKVGDGKENDILISLFIKKTSFYIVKKPNKQKKHIDFLQYSFEIQGKA